MTEYAAALCFAKSLAVGLLIGAERERHSGTQAGLRTFGLIAIAGTLAALLTDRIGGPWLLAAGLFAVTATMIAAYSRTRSSDQDAGTTSTIAALVCFCLGALLWYGESNLAVMLALGTTALLYFKSELSGAIQRLSKQDLMSFLQFAAISFVVLPMLPHRGFGPYGVLDPYRIWLMVVLISGIGLAGYVALRLAGPKRALPLIGMLGGLVSSTATTLAYARHARSKEILDEGASFVILLANLMTLVRLIVVAVIVAPEAVVQIGPMLAGGVLGGLWVPARIWLQLARDHQRPEFQLGAPTDLRTALVFAATFGLVLLASAWLNDIAGAAGVYLAAGISGLTDVDPITLSVFDLLAHGRLAIAEVCAAILLAFAANSLFKFGLVLFIATPAVRRRVAAGYATTLAGLALAYLLVQLTL